MKKSVKKFLTICHWSVYFLLGLWCAGALWYAFWHSMALKLPLMLLFILLWAAAPMLKKKCLLLTVWAAALLILAAFCRITTTNDKVWKTPFAVQPFAEFNNPAPGWVTLHNVRDFTYRSEHDFDVRYRTEVFDLRSVETVDFIMVHWGSEYVAHTMLSFGFADGRHLVLSMETRVPADRTQGALPGLYKQFNLMGIWGTERDLIGLRTNYRHEDLFLYPTATTPREAEILLSDLLHRTNSLLRQPCFYNTLTANCTNTLAPSVRRVWSLTSARTAIFNGHADKTALEMGWLQAPAVLPDYQDFKKRHYVNPRVDHLQTLDEGFSAAVRRPAE